MKKIISVVLAFILIAAMAMPSFAAASGSTPIPTVYVEGQGSYIYSADGSTQIYPIETEDGYISAAVQECLPSFFRALSGGDTAEYKEKLIGVIKPIYEKMRLNDDGERVDGSWTTWLHNGGNVNVSNKVSNGRYNIRAYNFNYDWRLDPFENAVELKTYIENIKRVTGAAKVNLLGRCEGSIIVMAYLAVYGHDDINKIIFMNPAFDGYLLSSQIFSGKLHFDGQAIGRWLEAGQIVEFGDDLAAQLLKSFLAFAQDSGLLNLFGDAVYSVFENILKDILPELILASYGTSPSTWAMVSVDDFDDAVNYVFNGREAQYAKLIEKIQRYYNDVKLKRDEIISSCIADGIDVGVVTKYGYPTVPIFELSNLLSDGFSTLTHSSFGATTTNVEEHFSDAYLAAAEANGTLKYISPDRQVDASTALLPDTTWIIGNLYHRNFPDSLDDFCAWFLATDDADINTDAAYPQYLHYEDDTELLVPMTEENSSGTVWDSERTVGRSFNDFINKLIDWFQYFIGIFRNLIEGIVAHARGTAEPVNP